MIDIGTKEDIFALKEVLIDKFPLLMTNVLKILLFKQEEKLGCLLTAIY